MAEEKAKSIELATLGGGCFWCTEAIFQRVNGVLSVMSGYAGGVMKNPSYEDVSSGTTGHAEAIQIEFDPSLVSYEKLLEIFWDTHDPTTPDRQGADVGTQYRSVIFTHSPEQEKTAESMKERLETSGKFPDPIVTEIVPFGSFYKAEDDHQNYYNENQQAGYCQIVITPKLRKFIKEHAKDTKPDSAS